jgi:hypothetical protein
MTNPRTTPEGPRTPDQAATPPIPHLRTSDKDLGEMTDPYDLPFPDDRWPQGRPAWAIVVDQLRGCQPGGPPSLAELLETGRTREPEPDLEAEP